MADAEGGGPRSRRPPLTRSASANWAGLRRASARAIAMKEEYDKVQTEKRLRSPPPVRVDSIREEDEVGREAETDVFLARVRHASVL